MEKGLIILKQDFTPENLNDAENYKDVKRIQYETYFCKPAPGTLVVTETDIPPVILKNNPNIKINDFIYTKSTLEDIKRNGSAKAAMIQALLECGAAKIVQENNFILMEPCGAFRVVTLQDLDAFNFTSDGSRITIGIKTKLDENNLIKWTSITRRADYESNRYKALFISKSAVIDFAIGSQILNSSVYIHKHSVKSKGDFILYDTKTNSLSVCTGPDFRAKFSDKSFEKYGDRVLSPKVDITIKDLPDIKDSEQVVADSVQYYKYQFTLFKDLITEYLSASLKVNNEKEAKVEENAFTLNFIDYGKDGENETSDSSETNVSIRFKHLLEESKANTIKIAAKHNGVNFDKNYSLMEYLGSAVNVDESTITEFLQQQSFLIYLELCSDLKLSPYKFLLTKDFLKEVLEEGGNGNIVLIMDDDSYKFRSMLKGNRLSLSMAKFTVGIYKYSSDGTKRKKIDSVTLILKLFIDNYTVDKTKKFLKRAVDSFKLQWKKRKLRFITFIKSFTGAKYQYLLESSFILLIKPLGSKQGEIAYKNPFNWRRNILNVIIAVNREHTTRRKSMSNMSASSSNKRVI